MVNRNNLGEVSFTAKIDGTGDAINPTSHDANGASFTGLNVAADVRSDIGSSLVRDDSKTVFQFKEQLRVVVIDRERAAIGMEEVVTEGGVKLVVQGIVGTEAVVDAAVGDVDVGEGLQGKGVAQQVLGDTQRGKNTRLATVTICSRV